MSDIPISIVICTHNRSHLLPVLFESLAAQTLPAGQRELLLVDNASTDATRRVTDGFTEIIPGLRYIHEAEVGLSAARNRGWRAARGAYIGFLDDDCKVPSGWLAVAAEIASEKHPGAFGGPYYAFYNTSKPAWFKDAYESYIPSADAHPLRAGEILVGGNMFIRRSLLAELGGFSPAFGMSGKKIAYGEETHFFQRLTGRYPDAVLYYDPRLFVYHLVRPEKMRLWTAPGRFFTNGRSYYRIHTPAVKPGLAALGRNLARLCAQLLLACTWGLVTRDRVEYPFGQNYVYEKCFKRFGELGMLVEALRYAIGRQAYNK